MDLIMSLLTAAGSKAPIVESAVESVGTTAPSDMQIALIAGGASLAGALIGALIPAIVTYIQNRSSREDERGFLAVQVSSALYTYANCCVDVAYDAGEHDDQGRLWFIVPSQTFNPLSLDVNWRTIPVKLLDRIFAISAAQRIVNERLGWEAENDFEYPVLSRQIEYGKLALRALDIAHDLRRAADLPPDPDGVIDLMSTMKEYVPSLEAKQAKIEQRTQEHAL